MVVTEATATEIMDAVENGERVAVIVPNIHVGHLVLKDLDEVVDLPSRDYTASPSRLEIRIGTGRVTLHSTRSVNGLRGMSVSRLYYPAGTDVPPEALPVLAVSGGAAIEYTLP